MIDLWPSPLSLAATDTVLTVQKGPSWHGLLASSTQSIWIHSFYYHQPGGGGGDKGKISPKSMKTTVLKTFAYLFQADGHTDTEKQQAHEMRFKDPFWLKGPP